MKTKINRRNLAKFIFADAVVGLFAVTLLSLAVQANGESNGAGPATGVFAQAEEHVSEVNKQVPIAAGKKVEQPVARNVSAPSPNLITAGTYAFTSSAGAALEDMSSGTTFALAADNDDNSTALIPISFDFWFDGVRHTLFSVNANGLMRLGVAAVANTGTNSVTDTTVQPSIFPYWDDLWLGNNGKIHYKVVGSAPTRKLVVEWLNEQVPRTGVAGVTGNSTFQAWLYESTGVIEFVYGAIPVTTLGYSVGIASGAASFASVTTSGNTVSYAAANNTQTTAITAGTKYTFTPNIPADPTGLNYTAVGLNTMTLNWTDNATNEFGYAIYRSVDGTNYEFIAQTAANAISYVATGLASNTTYFWQVYAVSEGGVSANPATAPAHVSSQATTTGTLSGTKSVGPTGFYATIGAAITDINTNGLAGNLVLELQAAYVSGGETFPLVLNTCGSPSNTITIRPEVGAVGLSITSANTTATLDLNGATAPFGPTNVVIDGRAGGAGPSQLTIANTATAGVAVRLINGASRNTIQFCTIQGVNTSTTGGVVLFSTSVAVPASNVTGNNNNTIDSCNVQDGATTPVNCITSIGSASTALLNTGNVISNNNISNFFSATLATRGINVTVNTNTSNTRWTIMNNRVFQTAARAYTTANVHNGIFVSGGHDYIVSGNVVGFANSAGTGTYTMSGVISQFIPIALSPGTSATTSVQGNTVAGISLTGTTAATSFFGISISSGSANIGTVTGNTVGSGTGNGSIALTNGTSGGFIIGLNANASAGLASVNMSNNTVGSFTATGSPATINVNINAVQLLGGQLTFTNNLIGSTTTANSIQQTTAGTAATAQQLLGITAGTTMPLNISNNTIANLTNAGTGTAHLIRGLSSAAPGVLSTASAGKASIVSNLVNNITSSNANTNFFGTAGILLSCGTGGAPFGGLIDRNTVNTIRATNAGAVATAASGISLTGASATVGVTGAVISTNKVYDIRNASTGVTATTPPVAVGIDAIFATTFGQVHNNMVSLGNAQTTNTEFIGIWHPASNTGTMRDWFNSVHIEGAVGAGALPSHCLLRGDNTAASAITTPVDIKNNILDNTRTGGTGKHYAIGNVNSVPATGWAAGASNFNVLNSAVAGTVGIWGLAADQTFAGWKSISGCDASSLSGVAVPFVDPANDDLHVNFGMTPTALESGGTAIAGLTIDFDMQTRPGPAGSVNGGATAPDIGADEFDGVPLDIAAPAISYAPLASTLSTSDRMLTATITDFTGVPTAGTLVPRIYYKKNAGSYFSQPGSLSSGTGTNGMWAFNIVVADMGGVVAGDVVSYFVIAQDTLGNIGSNPGGAVASDVNNVSSPPGSPNMYSILFSLSGTKTVGAGGGFDYPDLTTAINGPNGLNNSVVTGPVIFELQDPSYTNAPQVAEAFPLTINANSGSSMTNTVTFKPKAGQTVGITGSATTALFILNGADFIIFDGSNTVGGTTRDLTITNSSGGLASAVIWLQNNGADGATNNAIKNVNLVGTSNTTTLFGCGSGSSAIGLTSFGTGNNNNTFQNNSVSKTQYGMYSGGASAANKNTGNVITQNLINTAAPNNVSIGGILVNFENGVQITKNTISGMNFSGSFTSPCFGIAMGVRPSNTVTLFTGNDVVNAVVTGNSIGAVSHTNTGSSYGIVVNSVTSGTTLVANNMISGVGSGSNPTPADFIAGIVAGGGTGSTTQIYFNSVSVSGTQLGTSTSASYALAIASGNPIVDVKNNVLYNTQTNTGSTGKHYAIANASTTFTNMTSNRNDLFVSGAASFVGQTAAFNSGGTDQATLAAWQGATSGDANSISADPVFVSTTDLHLSSSSSPAANAGATGTGITTDIDGDMRSLIKPDMGADEIVSADLTNLVLSDGTLSPPFDPSITSYTASVGHMTTSITVTPTDLDSNASITVNGNATTSGSASPPLNLAVGNNNIMTLVTAEFGSPTKLYTVMVNRAALTAVSNTADSGAGSFRQTVADAVDGDTINFNLGAGTHTITLGSEVVINKNLTIDGSGSGSVILSGGGVTRVLNISSGKVVTLSALTIANGNAASSGGIQNDGDLTINNCLIANNTSAGDGGGMRNDGTLKVTNSTFSGNMAGTDGGAILSGIARSLKLGNVTMVKNTAGGSGGGLNSAGTTTIVNSIIALNSAASGNNIFSGAGTVTSNGYNLSNDNAGGFFTATGDQVNTDPMVGPLKNNGGPTFTHAPLSNSSAIDRGKDVGASGAATAQDQRFSARPVTYDLAISPPAGGDRSDIGAVELQPGVTPSSAVSRMTHGAAGDFDVALPLSGPIGIECRRGGATDDYQVVVTFASSVTFSGAAVNSGTGSVATSSGSGTNQLTINLTGVTNAQRLTVALFDVNNGSNSGDLGIEIGMLIGDTNADAQVDSSDVGQTKANAGAVISLSTFRTDVTVNGAINSSDVSLVKSKIGTGLP